MAECDLNKLNRRRALDNSFLSQFVGLAQVPAADVARFHAGLRLELDCEWLWYCRPDPAAARSLKKSAVVQLNKIAQGSSVLRNDLRNLNSSAIKSFMLAAAETEWLRALRAAGSDEQAPLAPRLPQRKLDFEMHEKAIALLEEISATGARALERPRRPFRGRPYRGASMGNGSLSLFTLRLLWDVRAAGGELTLDKNGRAGTLVTALAHLRPYLPPGLIPMELPVATLQGIKALAKKVADVADLSDNFRSYIRDEL